MPYLNILSAFRDSVRKLAIGKGDTALKDILSLSDRLRDVDLVPLGVVLDDQEGITNLNFRLYLTDQNIYILQMVRRS